MVNNKAHFEKSMTLTHTDAISFKQEKLLELYATYPQFFIENMPANLHIPVGWIEHIENAFKAFASTGFILRIQNMYMSDRRILLDIAPPQGDTAAQRQKLQEQYEESKGILEMLLSAVRKKCLLCGNEHPQDTLSFCTSCKQIFSLNHELNVITMDEEDIRF